MDDILLTIAIPTYNRSKFLDRCLHNICKQLKDVNASIELIVSDNASVDNTSEIIQKYKDAGYAIKYIKNIENKGADFNVAQCYTEAAGKYVLTLGDDDVLVTGGLAVIINTLSKNELGIVYLKNYAVTVDNFEDKAVVPEQVPVTILNNRIEFLKRVSYFTTFLSGNIVNKKALSGIDFAESRGSNLGHVPLILHAINSFDNNAIVEIPVIAMQTENTGGYSLFKTFGTNYMALLSKVYSNKTDEVYKNIIIKDLLRTFFPSWIVGIKSKNNFQKEDDINAIMYPLFKSYINYWLFNFPLIKLPGFASKLYFKAIKPFLAVKK